MLVLPGEYEMVLNTDSKEFGGFGLSDETIHHFTRPSEEYPDKGWLSLYIPSRSAFVLRRKPAPKKRGRKPKK
jgi:1,4-alpha-glucan branching enzyme